MRAKTAFCLMILPLVALGCGRAGEPAPETGIRVDGTLDFVGSDGSVIHAISIEIADTDAARQRGLMNRRGMAIDEGMLFIFPEPDSLSFWMRNTAMPLDIIFVDAEMNIVNIAERTRPLSDDFIRATAPAQYVVEVRGGVSARFGIDERTAIRWKRSSP